MRSYKLKFVFLMTVISAILSCNEPDGATQKPSKIASPPPDTTVAIAPYKSEAANTIYNLLFCDDLTLLKAKMEMPYKYPYDILFAENSSVSELQRIIDDTASDPRIIIWAYNRQRALHHIPAKKELLAVIVEVDWKKVLMYWLLFLMELPGI